MGLPLGDPVSLDDRVEWTVYASLTRSGGTRAHGRTLSATWRGVLAERKQVARVVRRKGSGEVWAWSVALDRENPRSDDESLAAATALFIDHDDAGAADARDRLQRALQELGLAALLCERVPGKVHALVPLSSPFARSAGAWRTVHSRVCAKVRELSGLDLDPATGTRRAGIEFPTCRRCTTDPLPSIVWLDGRALDADALAPPLAPSTVADDGDAHKINGARAHKINALPPRKRGGGRAVPVETCTAAQTPWGRAAIAAGWGIRAIDAERLEIACPLSREHTRSGRVSREACILADGTLLCVRHGRHLDSRRPADVMRLRAALPPSARREMLDEYERAELAAARGPAPTHATLDDAIAAACDGARAGDCSIVVAPAGAGKTTAMIGRIAASTEPAVVLSPTHDRSRATATALEARGVATYRRLSVLRAIDELAAERGVPRSSVCPHVALIEAAGSLGGTPVCLRCDQQSRCEARARAEAACSERVIAATHAGAPRAREDDALWVDEQPQLDIVVVAPDDRERLKHGLGLSSTARDWARKTVAAIQRAVDDGAPLELSDPPSLSQVLRPRLEHVHHATLGSYARLCALSRSPITVDEDGRWCASDAADALLATRGAVVLDATPVLSALPRQARARARIYAAPAVDRARRVWIHQRLSRTALWGRGESCAWPRLLRAIEAARSVAGAFVGWLVVTYQRLADTLVRAPSADATQEELAVRAALRGASLAHFGPALRGRDDWANVPGVLTLGDPRPPADAVAAALADDEDADAHARAVARALLAQAHGRARAPQRGDSPVLLHVGQLCPYGWPDDPSLQVVSRPRGSPRARPAEHDAAAPALDGASWPDELSAAELAARLGIALTDQSLSARARAAGYVHRRIRRGGVRVYVYARERSVDDSPADAPAVATG